MGTEYADVFRALAAPLENVKSFSKGGRQMKYVSARTVMNRLDDVLGPENWWDDYEPREHSVICRLSIRLPSGDVVTKPDAGAYAGMDDEGDDDKSGFSDAFKRAAVKFGVGRHIYGDGVPSYAASYAEGRPRSNPTNAPEREAMPPRAAAERAPEAKAPDFRERPKAGTPGAFWWFKAMGDHFRCPLVKKVEEIAEARGMGKSFKDWGQADLDEMVQRSVAYLRKQQSYAGELDHLVAADGGGGDDADAAKIEGARAALYAKAALLWNASKPGIGFTDEDILEVVRGVSQGSITDLRSCQDYASIKATLETVAKLIEEHRRRN